jgi:alpha-1,3-rhamnosyl/mannosyltransferase
VIASDRSSLPEVVGDGGLLVDPTNLSLFASALATLLRAPERRAALAQAGLARAARFSWAATADQTVAVYARALGSGHASRAARGARPAAASAAHPAEDATP